MRNGPPVKREANQEENDNQNFAQFFSPSEDEGIRLQNLICKLNNRLRKLQAKKSDDFECILFFLELKFITKKGSDDSTMSLVSTTDENFMVRRSKRKKRNSTDLNRSSQEWIFKKN